MGRYLTSKARKKPSVQNVSAPTLRESFHQQATSLEKTVKPCLVQTTQGAAVQHLTTEAVPDPVLAVESNRVDPLNFLFLYE